MIEVVGVTFNDRGRCYYFLPGNKKFKLNITVVVETEKGLEFGKITKENFLIEEEKITSPLKNVVRVASKEDFNNFKKNQKDAKEALDFCKKQIEKLNLNMVILEAHYTLDREQLVFKFLSDNRVDFRELAKSLASKYKTRIDLRQIGARDKAREVGGCGQCGRTLCCSGFLNELDSVSINMAKNQNIALNPSKINGLCGRLLCCLKYEDEQYKDCRKCLPKVGQTVSIPEGPGKVVDVDILNLKYYVDIEGKGTVEVKK